MKLLRPFGVRRHLDTMAFASALSITIFMAAPAFALSEIQREELPSPTTTTPLPPAEPNPSLTIPQPDTVSPPTTGVTPQPEQPRETEEDTVTEPDGPLPAIEYDLTKLPEPVRQMHDRMLQAAKTGDLESLRPLLGTGEEETQLSLGGVDGDPIQFLKELSGDDQGQEILAIMEEVLSAGFVRLEAGTANELFVWPYFFAIPLDKLTAAQRVELFKIVTAGDYEDMKTYGSYIFYRVGISAEGKWSFFIAGD